MGSALTIMKGLMFFQPVNPNDSAWPDFKAKLEKDCPVVSWASGPTDNRTIL
jgi:hypothetical protein